MADPARGVTFRTNHVRNIHIGCIILAKANVKIPGNHCNAGVLAEVLHCIVDIGALVVESLQGNDEDVIILHDGQVEVVAHAIT